MLPQPPGPDPPSPRDAGGRRAAWTLGVAAPVPGAAPAGARPNFVILVLDDLGFSDLGCYGGEIRTPNIDKLAADGLRFRRFYNSSRCCPTRASLLTGLYPHQVGLARNGRDLSRDAATVAEQLRASGYQTAMAGKWHLSSTTPLGGNNTGREHLAWLNHQADRDRPFANPATYPINRGFDRHYGPIWGVIDYFDPFSLVDGTKPVQSVPDDFYLTDAINNKAVEYLREMTRKDDPFFLYVAETAPHWPLHALPEDIARYKGRYDQGWQALREERYRKQVAMGLVDPKTQPLPPLMGPEADWDALTAEQRGTKRPSWKSTPRWSTGSIKASARSSRRSRTPTGSTTPSSSSWPTTAPRPNATSNSASTDRRRPARASRSSTAGSSSPAPRPPGATSAPRGPAP